MRLLSLARARRLFRKAAARVRRRPRTTMFVSLLVVGLLAGATTLLVTRDEATPAPIAGGPIAGSLTLPELSARADAGEVVAVTIAKAASGDPVSASLTARTSDGQLWRVPVEVDPVAAASALATLGHGGLLTADAWAAIRSARAVEGGDPARGILGWIVPILMLLVLLVVLFRFLARRREGRDTATWTRVLPEGHAEATTEGPMIPDVRLADVAGCEEAKLELTEAIEFLRAPDRFHRLGARIPRGVLLYGPPGTGKTMLARAVAAEAGVPFLAASGAEFIEKYVGVGSKRVRDLFREARRHGRAVVFIDEFDALGKARGGANSHEEREQTLNQLLVELDGFNPNDGVVVIAATNRLDILDSAVLRPGRFNRKIHVGLPDVAGRLEILEVHARGKPIGSTVDLQALARKTYGFSGAQLADLLNEAAILAARRTGEELVAEDVHGGWLKVAVGTGRRRSMDERERSIIAAHEIGHAICGRVHGDKRKVEEISLFAHGEALGVTVSSQEDNDLPSESDLRARLVALMGGRAAEELLFREVTGGAANDFDHANRIASTMVTKWGMGRDPEANDTGISGRGALSFLVARNGSSLPTEVQAAATRATRAILDEAYADACRTLVEHIDLLRLLAAYLVEHERVDGETFDALVEGTIPVPNALLEWRPAAARPRAWADIPDYHAERRRPTSMPMPVPAAATLPAVGHASAAPAVAGPTALAIQVADPGGRRPRTAVERRVGGRRLGRRFRRFARGQLEQAHGWLRAAEADPEV
ncbi:MAG TPA: AAA family ATPase [Vitreimonas sp.]|nr:AAA family ATPase [Vitreimonas sp.]